MKLEIAKEKIRKLCKKYKVGEGWEIKFKGNSRYIAQMHHPKKSMTFAQHLIERGSEEDFNNVVLHEIAHLIVARDYGLGKTHSHGKEFKAVCKKIEAPSAATYQLSYEIEYPWLLVCKSCSFSDGRFRKIDVTSYLCSKCQNKLSLIKNKTIEKPAVERKGQIVNRTKSKGKGVNESWVELFLENEAAFTEGVVKKVKTDEQITEAMYNRFPDRRDSEIFGIVCKVRNRYNRGLLTRYKIPEIKSFRYLQDEEGGLTQVPMRTRKKRSKFP